MWINKEKSSIKMKREGILVKKKARAVRGITGRKELLRTGKSFVLVHSREIWHYKLSDISDFHHFADTLKPCRRYAANAFNAYIS